MNEAFRRFAHRVSQLVGTSWAFILAVLVILVWSVTGPMFGYSDTWQLVINTGTTIVTFLMVFLIQNTQNRDAKAIHLKLDELIKAVKGARTGLVNLEELSDSELERLQKEFARLQKEVNHNEQKTSLDEYEDTIEAAQASKEIRKQSR
jgi:low affinity Fe/Cu permease